MASKIHTKSRRFNLVKGQVSATPDDGYVSCGDGTAYPLLVTLDQLIEIIYRVRDAAWVSGDFETGSYGSVGKVFVNSVPPTVALVDAQEWTTDFSDLSIRGYCSLITDNDLTPEEADPFPAKASPSELLADVYSFTLNEAYTGADSVLSVREATSEMALWLNAAATTDHEDIGKLWTGSLELNDLFGAATVGDYPSQQPTGFNVYTHQWRDNLGETSPQVYGVTGECGVWNGSGYDYETGPSVSSLNVGLKVAWVDTAASGNPFDPANQLFLQVDFAAQVIDLSIPYSYCLISTNKAGLTDPVDAGVDLILELAGSIPVSCNIYYDKFYATASGFLSEPDELSGNDFIIAANKWWGYDGKFNTTTGARL